MDMLDALMSWIEEAPPQPQSSQRFGNLAFRTYISLVEQVSGAADSSRWLFMKLTAAPSSDA